MREDMGMAASWEGKQKVQDRRGFRAFVDRALGTVLPGARVVKTPSLRHLETLALGHKRSVYLVECDGERFLIAAGGEGLSTPVPLTQKFSMRDVNVVEERPR